MFECPWIANVVGWEGLRALIRFGGTTYDILDKKQWDVSWIEERVAIVYWKKRSLCSSVSRLQCRVVMARTLAHINGQWDAERSLSLGHAHEQKSTVHCNSHETNLTTQEVANLPDEYRLLCCVLNKILCLIQLCIYLVLIWLKLNLATLNIAP